jgi:TonB-dependent receptor
MEIIKAPTPDMDADAIGGTVNLKSRSAFDLTGRRIRFSVGGLYGYSRYEDPRPAATIFYSDEFNAFGGEKNLGVSFTSNFRQHVASMDFSNLFHQNTPDDPAYIRQISFDGRVNQRTRWGGGLKFDYKLTDDHAVFANFTMSPHSERAHVPVYTVSTAQTVATLDAQGRPTGNGAILPDYTSDRTEARSVPQSQVAQSYLHRQRDNDAYSAQLGGRLLKPGYELDYDASYSVSEQKQFYHQSSAAVTGVGWMVDRTNGWRWTPELTFTDGRDPFDLDAYRNNLLLRFHQPTEGSIVGAQLNFRKNFELPVPTWVKAGIKVRSEKQIRKDLSRRWRFEGPDGVLNSGDENLSQFVSESWNHRSYNGHYPAIPVISPAEMATSIQNSPGMWQEDVTYGTTQRLNNDQQLDETVYASYLMGNVKLGQLSILAGVRVEHTEVEGTGPLNRITDEERARRAAWVGPVTDEETIRRLTAQYGSRRTVKGKYRDVFPGVHLKFEPVRGIILRGSYSTSIGRPNFGSILPREVVNEDDMIVSVNNTKLQPQYS